MTKRRAAGNRLDASDSQRMHKEVAMAEDSLPPETPERNEDYTGAGSVLERKQGLWDFRSSPQPPGPSVEELAVLRKAKRRQRDREYNRAKNMDEGHREKKRT